jgi:hypothetical protein
MKSRAFVALAFCLVVTMAISVSGAGRKSDVTVVNQSAWDIHHLYLSAADENEWGPDQLGNDVIGTGDSFKIMGIPCDEYDVRLVDEDGDECMVFAVDICGSNEKWEITSGDLLECEAS